jgi:GTPase SAR1 family protein
MILNIIEIKINDDLIKNKSLLEGLFFECHCALFLIDLTAEKSFESFKELITSLELNDTIGKDDNKYLSQILVLNKIDLESDIKVNKESIKEF